MLLALAGGMPAAATADSTAATAAVATGRYSLDAENSSLLIHTGRAGWLAALGHRHVLAVKALQGALHIAVPRSASTAWLEFPVAAIEVDAAELRDAAGDGFESTPSDADISATYHNMLGPQQLNGAAHPRIRLEFVVREWRSSELALRLSIDVAGQHSEHEVTAELTGEGSGIRVAGELQLSQSALGIEPFNALGGSLQVADSLRVRYDLRARRVVD